MAKRYRTQHFHFTELVGTVAFFSVILIQYFLRPAYGSSDHALIRFSLGVAPNFLGGIAMTIAFFIYQLSKQVRYKQHAFLVTLISFLAAGIGLWIWEYLQLIAHRFYDINDVMASWCGAFISGMLILVHIQWNKKNGIRTLE